MNKKVRLTFDIETITTGFSISADVWHTVTLGALYLAKLLKERNLKATFFISLSKKNPKINREEFLSALETLIYSLKGFDNIRLEPHIHAFDLPLSFDCKEDFFSCYSDEEQLAMLNFAKDFFSKFNIEVNAFRPGGYHATKEYYANLKKAGFSVSSLLDINLPVNIDLTTNKIIKSDSFYIRSGIKEFPVTSVKVKSIKGKTEIVNLSPDFFTLESVLSQIEEISDLTINAHSFSLFTSRLMRENHKRQLRNNVKFMLFDRLLNKILSKNNIFTMYRNTIAGTEIIKWLDYFYKNKWETLFLE